MSLGQVARLHLEAFSLGGREDVRKHAALTRSEGSKIRARLTKRDVVQAGLFIRLAHAQSIVLPEDFPVAIVEAEMITARALQQSGQIVGCSAQTATCDFNA